MSWEAVESQIVDRLTDKLGTTVKKVYTAAEFNDVPDDSQFTPSVAVIYGGYSPTQTGGGSAGKVQEIEVTWLLVVAVRSALNTRTRQGTREDSAPIVQACIESLIGWRPPIAGEMPLKLTAAPEAQRNDAGVAFYPIAFTNRRTYRGLD